MTSSIAQRMGSLSVRFKEMQFWRNRAALPLDGWTFDGEPLEREGRWPSRDGVKTLVLSGVSVPGDWALEDVRLELNLGGEGLVRLHYGDGDDEGFGLDPFHGRFPLRARNFDIEAEVVARYPFGQPNRDARLEHARLVLNDSAVERLERQIRMVWEAARVLESHEVVEPMVAAAERALRDVQWPSETHAYVSRRAASSELQKIWELPAGLPLDPDGLSDMERASVAAASTRLEEDLLELRTRFPREGSIRLTGHAHLDLIWLWPLEETRRKARRTFSTITGLMDRYPEFRFNQSTAQVYAFIEEDDPHLFGRIQEKVATGQWEPVGGMWVEPDINMPAGESLVRQLLYGQRYFQRAFGKMHTVCWLPDCFGFAPGLPQILRLAGIENFFTIKLTWSETNVFPYDLFWWEGLDGSRVLGHMFNNPGHRETDTGGYNGDSGPFALVNTWRNYRGKDASPQSLLSIGYGDGGGGVTAEMVEQVRTLESFPTLPRAHFGSVEDFYDRTRDAVGNRELPTWLGEMYLELHRGTLTTQGRTKRLHRQAERALVAAEVLASMSYLLGGEEPRSLESQWRILLRNEFHDVLPGSSIREVYARAEEELATVVSESENVIASELDNVAGALLRPGEDAALLVVNPDISERPVRLQFAGSFSGAQEVEGGSVLCGDQTVPGLGARILVDSTVPGELSVSTGHLENEYVRVELADNGSLRSVYHKSARRETLAGRGNQLWAYVDKPSQWDAWDIDAGYVRQGEELEALESIDVVESGPHRAAIRLVRRFRHSTVTQDIRLWANSPRVEFRTTLDWHDRRWLLKARFPLAVRANHATFETAFGVLQRPTHRNTSWESARFEVAGHRFADLSEPDYGVALLNDGKYGHHALGNELGLSLLRSPIYPDPLADEGIQTFTYALYPHRGTVYEGGVLAEAEDLNRPLLALPVRAHAQGPVNDLALVRDGVTWQALRLDGLPLALGSLKVAEDGGRLVLRTYEPGGARGSVSLALPPGWVTESEVDLLERPTGPPELSFDPFQIRSWMLQRDG
ncbi:MAG: alpha-mannosidase [Chloroflexota bacterium]